MPPKFIIKKQDNGMDIQGFIIETTKRISKEHLKEMHKEILDEVDKFVSDKIDKQVANKIKGERGDVGPKGPMGLSIKGEKGDRGDNGNDGKNGYSPIKGFDYHDGKNGKDGSPDSPEQVVDKVNEAKNKIDKKRIDGLEEQLIMLGRSIKEKSGGVGGGMGNFVAETPTGLVNNLNTVFTLSKKPKTNSLILLWNGQFQRNGASFEYTLSEKTITFNTAPTAGEIYAYYIRK